ncbi:hypothetical protein C8J56DRAFT_1156852 [Mycena floridula]|nr:hypothetical protein C8J56DRAFT_1156852 [Mycena floridula]
MLKRAYLALCLAPKFSTAILPSYHSRTFSRFSPNERQPIRPHASPLIPTSSTEFRPPQAHEFVRILAREIGGIWIKVLAGQSLPSSPYETFIDALGRDTEKTLVYRVFRTKDAATAYQHIQAEKLEDLGVLVILTAQLSRFSQWGAVDRCVDRFLHQSHNELFSNLMLQAIYRSPTRNPSPALRVLLSMQKNNIQIWSDVYGLLLGIKSLKEEVLAIHGVTAKPRMTAAEAWTNYHAKVKYHGYRRQIRIRDWTAAFAQSARLSTEVSTHQLIHIFKSSFRSVASIHRTAFRPTIVSWTIFLRGLEKRRAWREGRKYTRILERSGLRLDGLSIRVALVIMTRGGYPVEALEILEKWCFRVDVECPFRV